MDENLTTSWQGCLQAYAQAIRQMAVQHPAAFPLVATRHPAAAWLRPPLRSIELAEDFLTTLSSHGLTDHEIVGIYRTFSSFLLGSLLLESAVRRADTSPLDEPLDHSEEELDTTLHTSWPPTSAPPADNTHRTARPDARDLLLPPGS